ncbi:MAG: hypothetical protein K2P07_06800, partial [Lachnospiraceae bacterium]|nr:hypothetical protein [Lachnospiraceae bacterium]
MKKKMLCKLMAAALTAAMVLPLGACGSGSAPEKSNPASGTEENASSEKEVTEETVTLTIWNTEVTTPGIQDNDVARVIEEKLGIKMDIVQGDSQKFSVLVAGGDLPDIIYSNPAQQGVE